MTRNTDRVNINRVAGGPATLYVLCAPSGGARIMEMKMMQSSAYGRLGQEPRSITTQSGNAMAVASVAVSVGEHDEPPLWIGILAFGKMADDLLRHQKGDMLSVSGRVQRSTWTNAAGEKREQLQIVADTIISSRTVRPARATKAHQGQMPI